VPALKELYDARTRLNDLLAKLDGNDDLEALLHDVASNTEKRDQLRTEAPKQESQSAAEGAEASAADDGGKDGDKKGDKDGAKKGGK
jgi:type VI secretion system protein ImpB